MAKLSKEFVEGCLKLADDYRSKLTEMERTMPGDCSSKLRSFLNNVVSKENTKYLEIGLFRGSSFIPALYGNLKTKAVGVDHWMYDRTEPRKVPPKGFIWDNVKSGFEDNLNRYSRGDMTLVDKNNITLIEEDFNTVKWATQPKFDVINFDIQPMKEEDIDALFDKVLRHATANEFILILNRYSLEEVEVWTKNIIEKYKLSLNVDWELRRISSSTSDTYNYFSGIGVFGMSKKSIQTPKATATPATLTKKGPSQSA